jgi:hypothetical protein
VNSIVGPVVLARDLILPCLLLGLGWYLVIAHEWRDNTLRVVAIVACALATVLILLT